MHIQKKKNITKKILAFMGAVIMLVSVFANCFTVGAASCAHNDSEIKWIPNYDGTHDKYEYCYDCDKILDNEYNVKSEPCYYDYGDTTKPCCYCKAMKPCTKHDFSVSTRCSVCGYECEHLIETENLFPRDYADEHAYSTCCFECGEQLTDLILEDCTFVDGICSVCKAPCEHIGSITTTYTKGSNNGSHIKTDFCAKCNSTVSTIVESCTYDGDTCICGNLEPATPCQHLGDYTTTYNSTTSTKHTKYYHCVDCGEIFLEKEESCTFDTNNECICGNVKPCTHSDGEIYDETVSTNDGKHDFYNNCTLCGVRVLSSKGNPCIYDNNGVCMECGYNSNIEVPTEEPTEEPTEDNTEDNTEDITPPVIVPPSDNGDYNDGYLDGYYKAYDDIYNTTLLKSKYYITVNFTDHHTGLTSTVEYQIPFTSYPSASFNYVVGDGLVLKDVFQICKEITFTDDMKIKATINSVTVKIVFDKPIVFNDEYFYLSLLDGYSTDEIAPHDYHITATTTENKRLGCVVWSDLDNVNKYCLAISIDHAKSFVVSQIEIGVPVERIADTQYLVLYTDTINAIHHQISYDNGFYDGNKSGLEIGFDNGYNEGYYHGNLDGYNKGYDEAYKTNNNFFTLITSVYDGMTNTFFGLFSFEILGVNLAGFILSIVTLLIVVFIWRKVV